MEVVTVGGQIRLVTVSRGIPGVTAFVMAEGVGMQLTGQLGLSPALSATAEPELTFVATPAGNALLTTGLATLAPYSHWLTASGSFATPSYWGDADAAGIHLAEAAAVQTGTGQVLFASRYDAPGLWSFEINASGAAVVIESLPAINGAPAAVISDIVVLAGGGTQWLVTALADQDRLVAYAINPDGTTGVQQSIGAPDGLGIAVPTALATVAVGQVEYLLLASAQSSTLTVFRLDQNGVLVAADNIVDSLYTRFAAASQVEAISTHGRAFVVVAGSDDGLSLFTILPGGRLLLLATYSDNAVSTLANVSSLAMAVLGQELQIVAASSSEPGLTQFALDLSRVGLTLVAGVTGGILQGSSLDDLLSGDKGNDSLSGGAGNDILVDGFGCDGMTGGTGADIFVFAADGKTDVVLDFNPAEDRLDLSAFSLLYNVYQLIISPTVWGAIIEYEDERIEIHSSTGSTLTSSVFTNANVLNLMRVPDITDVTTSQLSGTSASDVITGGAGNEAIYGFDEADRLSGAGGHDQIYGGAHSDWLDGGDGDDLIFGDSGDDVASGGSGNDDIFGGAGQDQLVGGADADRMWGDSGEDTVFGNAGIDTLFGGDDNDFLFGGLDNDWISGEKGADRIYGESGDDTLLGDDGDDTLFGGLGGDHLCGGAGDDRLFGQEGADRLDGGAGNDVLMGEGGSDVFVFFGSFGSDTIVDFDVSPIGDMMDLSMIAEISDFTDLVTNHAMEIGGNVIFAFSAGHTITVLNTTIAAFDFDDFLF